MSPGCPYAQRAAVEEPIAGTFERNIVGHTQHRKVLRAKPTFEMRLLALTLREAEVADHRCVVEYKTGVSRKHHIGQTRLGFDQLNVRQPCDRRQESIPLMGST